MVILYREIRYRQLFCRDEIQAWCPGARMDLARFEPLAAQPSSNGLMYCFGGDPWGRDYVDNVKSQPPRLIPGVANVGSG